MTRLPVFALGVGLSTMGMMFVAIGVFFSALTKNQVVAAIWTFVVLFLLVVMTLLAYFYAARQQTGWATRGTGSASTTASPGSPAAPLRSSSPTSRP